MRVRGLPFEPRGKVCGGKEFGWKKGGRNISNCRHDTLHTVAAVVRSRELPRQFQFNDPLTLWLLVDVCFHVTRKKKPEPRTSYLPFGALWFGWEGEKKAEGTLETKG